MIEKAILDEYRTGKRVGIAELDDCFYIPVRITDSGLNTRIVDGEKLEVNRERGEFFNDAFIQHCKTLPILCDHPKTNGGMLNSDNLADNPIIGNVIDAWKHGSEVLGVARIIDKSLLSKIDAGKINSTSPAIYIAYESDGLEQNRLKEVPLMLNHLAFVDLGHWDFNGEGSSPGFDASQHEKIVNLTDLPTDLPTDLTDLSENTIIADRENLISNSTKGVNMPNDINETKAEATTDAVEQTAPAVAVEPVAQDVEPTEIPAVENSEIAETKDSETAEIAPAVQSVGGDFIPDEEPAVASHEEAVFDSIDSDKIEEVADEDAETEVVDSEAICDEDKCRERAVDAMQKAVDSAHESLGVKMPHIEGRQTLRSATWKFLKMNRRFVSAKYKNLAVDSFTNELADDVLNDTFKNIEAESEKLGSKKVKGWNDSGKGYSTYFGF